jgi:acyl phosphate:glycerol-3-phosphate acyltransferase
MEKISLVCILAYLAGSINFAIIFFKVAGKADPRLQFSGNAGTTNVYRQAGRVWAAVVFLLDIGRAVAIAALATCWLQEPFIPWAGFFLILGNSFPCFHGFHGGKGVANYLGFTAYVTPLSALLAIVIWLAVYGVYRIPFIASFFMVFALSIRLEFSFDWNLSAIIGASATFVLILFNHRINIIEYWKSKERITPSG